MSLSILIWLPVVLALLATMLPARHVGMAATALSAIPLGIAVDFVGRFNSSATGLQFVTNKVWIASLGIHYKLGINGLNVALILLTTVLFTVSLAWSAQREVERPKLYYFYFGLAESAVLGAFTAQDLVLFVGFFDLMLIPFYFLVGSWGSGDRVRATIKMVIYTMVGSFLMLAAAIAAGVLASSQHGTPINFTFTALQHLGLSHTDQDWIFLGFAAAFVVKMPLTPFHGWLADAYKSMPIPAVAVFSGVVSKVAAYGFLQIVLPIFPQASHHFQTLMLVIALVSILWGTAIAFTTRDARLVIAYSSVAQMGFIALGIFSLKPTGGQGALLQMLNHGVVTAAAFFVVAAVAARAGGSENLDDMGGIAFRAPVLATFFLIVTFANLAMPGSSNFIGEFMILLGAFTAHIWVAVVASLGVVGAAYYALRLFIGSMHNRQGPKVTTFELDPVEAIAIVPLVLIILALAFYPQFGLGKSETSVKAAIAPAALYGSGQGINPGGPMAAASSVHVKTPAER
ncbi:MAG TPA: NADH-quinone oxidoreductase subunit M [Solirubrobacteraceae bacterium]|nr:NADH-quinone oxidoreductase subunit M [Solirubrobacteraceae bacterium]